jgi:hypothetical protein
VPLGLAAAVSPVMFAEQTVMLAGANGRTVAVRYAAGVALVAILYVGALVLWGRAIALPERPRLSSTMDLVFGLILIVVATLLWFRQRSPDDAPATARKSVRAGGAFGFGIVSMATNFTTLALLVPAAKAIAASRVDVAGRLILVAVLVALATIPAWLPVALTIAAPGPASRGLQALNRMITLHGRTLVVAVVAALGGLLIVRGILALADL